MLVTAFYNMADTFFVGTLKSNAATGAVGIVFSLMAIIQAVGFFFGQGSGNFISRAIGRKDYEEASDMASTGFFSALTTGVLICVLGLVFLEPLAYPLGSTDTILPYTKAYLRVILLGAPWMTASLVLNNQLRFQGSAAYAMVGITSWRRFEYRAGSAADFYIPDGDCRCGLGHHRQPVCQLLPSAGGLPQGRQPAVGNFPCEAEGGPFRLDFQGRPAVTGPAGAGQRGHHLPESCRRALRRRGHCRHGRGAADHDVRRFRHDRLWSGLSAGVRLQLRRGALPPGAGGLLVQRQGGLCAAAGRQRGGLCLCAPQLVAIFRDDPEVVAIGAAALRYQCATFCLQSWVVMGNMCQQTMGLTVPATFMAVARQGLFFIPVVWLLALTIGLPGIQMAQMVADLLAFACSVPLQLHVLNRLKLLESGKITRAGVRFPRTGTRRIPPENE